MAQPVALSSFLPVRERKSETGLAARDVLLVCPNRTRREDLAEIFERRGLSVIRSFEGYDGITAVRDREFKMVVLVPDRHGRGIAKLIRYARQVRPQAALWLIGNPQLLRLADVVHREEVPVLPSSIDAPTLERLFFGWEKPSGIQATPPLNGKRIIRPQWLRLTGFAENFHQARTEFETRFITRALRLHDGNISLTAKAIRLERRNLQFKIRTLGIDIESTQSSSETEL